MSRHVGDWVSFLLVFMVAPVALHAQSEIPIEIFADDGIEWDENKKIYVARGAAQAIQGSLTVDADILTAHYRAVPEGETKIWRLNADGNVRIRDGESVVTGQRALYDLDQDILVLTGQDLAFTSNTDRVTSQKSLEYWRGKKLAVARGDAFALREGKEIYADILSAYFGPAKDIETDTKKDPKTEEKQDSSPDVIERMEAFGNVKIVTPSEVVRGDKGFYNAQTEVISLFGSVKIVRDTTQLRGEYGEVNLKTGVSRLLSSPSGQSTQEGKVKAIIKPAQ